MAYTKKTQVETENAVESTVAEKTVAEKVTKPAKPAKKKFAPTDEIMCKSITPGKLFYVGGKTKKLYTFAGMDDEQPIEFQDLDYGARSKDKMMYKPRFVINDTDFLSTYPQLNALYTSLHSVGELKNILKMTPNQMAKAINSLPPGAKDAVKTLAMTAIDNGTLDSIQRVKKLDEIFETKMLSKLTSE